MAKQAQKAPLTRAAAATQAVRSATGPTTLTELTEKAWSLFGAAGGKCERETMRDECKSAIRSAQMFGLIEVRRNELTIVPITPKA